MKPITLEALEIKSKEFAELVAKFKAERKTQFVFPETEIQLAHGEHYAGVILGKDGEPSHHLILLPEDKDSGKWQAAIDWAKSINGELPSHREQALLYANLKEQFQEQWYWSAETHAYDADYAWYQRFCSGIQSYTSKDGYSCRARAVRRLVIE